MSSRERVDSLPFKSIFQPRTYIIMYQSITSETKEEGDFMLSRDCRLHLIIAKVPIVGGKNEDGSVTFTLSEKGLEKVEELMCNTGFESHKVEKE